jgi:hypothetical protein
MADLQVRPEISGKTDKKEARRDAYMLAPDSVSSFSHLIAVCPKTL